MVECYSRGAKAIPNEASPSIIIIRINTEPTQVLTLSLREWLAERRIQLLDLRTKSMNEADAEG